MDNQQAIGIFDSGIGGLTVFKEVRGAFPAEDVIYLGDTAHVPYGTKSPETVLRYTIRNSLFLLERGVKAIIIACNTASAYGLDILQRHFKVPVLGVIAPGAETALAVSKSRRIGVIGTEGTIRSEAYQKVIKSLDASAQTVGEACPLLVGMAEEGWVEGEVVDRILKTYLKRFMPQTENQRHGRDEGEALLALPVEGATRAPMIDTLILGCTHYPLFKESIGRILGDSVSLVDSAVAVTERLRRVLDQAKLIRTDSRKGESLFFSTDAPDRMQRIGHRFLGGAIGNVAKVEIASY